MGFEIPDTGDVPFDRALTVTHRELNTLSKPVKCTSASQ